MMTKILTAYYGIRKLAVKIHQEITPNFVIRDKTLPQGDVLSPLEYSLAVGILP